MLKPRLSEVWTITKTQQIKPQFVAMGHFHGVNAPLPYLEEEEGEGRQRPRPGCPGVLGLGGGLRNHAAHTSDTSRRKTECPSPRSSCKSTPPLRPGLLLIDHHRPHPEPSTPGSEQPLSGHGLSHWTPAGTRLLWKPEQVKRDQWSAHLEDLPWSGMGRGDTVLTPHLPVTCPSASGSASLSLYFPTCKMGRVWYGEIARSPGRERAGRRRSLHLSLNTQDTEPAPSLSARTKGGSNRSGCFENCPREREEASKHLLGAYCVLCPHFISFHSFMNPFR